jgi:hypothetical protein
MREVLALVSERLCNRFGDGHLEADRIAILRRLTARRDHGDLRGTPGERGKPDVDPHRRDVLHLDRNDARGQAIAAACRARNRFAAVLRMEQEDTRRGRRRSRTSTGACGCAGRDRAPRDTRTSSAPEGHTVVHAPQPTHRCGSTATRSPSGLIASAEQTSMHLLHPSMRERLCAHSDSL